jgi:hypothetical protein
MPTILDHLDQVSIFGRSLVALFVLLGLDWSFSAAHAYEEWRGEGVPLWRVFGAVVGLWLPNWLGFILFTLGLTLILWSAGLVAIVGWFPFAGDVSLPVAVGALGFVIGARISDTLISHWGLYGLGYRPNPGLKSTPLYVLEAAVLLLTFRQGLSLSRSEAFWGFACGAGFFILVLPVMRACSAIAVPWRRTPWTRWRPLPAWTKEQPSPLVGKRRA